MKILSIVGARPQFIKAAVISRAIRGQTAIEQVLVHTGQHYDQGMSAVFFRELDIPAPEYHLGIGSASHGAQTGRMLEAMEPVLLRERPDWVLVYGDTNSTLAGALAAAKLKVPVAHVEAGLRSFNKAMPEEVNRVLTDHLSDLLFTPTATAENNLKAEGISRAHVCRSGDVMYDAALYYGERSKALTPIVEGFGLQVGGYVLATVHRVENTDNPQRLEQVFQGLAEVAEHYPVIMPMHPRTRHCLQEHGLLDAAEAKLMVIEPVSYLQMVGLEKGAHFIITDSGGVQKEAFFHRVPCLTLRDETEWPELVENGFNQLIGANPERLVAALDTVAREGLAWDNPLYGNGRSAEKIVAALEGYKG